MAQDIFLHFDSPTLPGPLIDPQFTGWFALQSLGWGLERPVGGKAAFHEFIITKEADQGSSRLMFWAASGKALLKVRIEIRNSGTTPFVAEEYVLENGFVTFFQNMANVGEDFEPEELHIAVAKVTYTSRWLTGTVLHSETHVWDQSTETGA
jgi:type VI protein secretion system component Hcp